MAATPTVTAIADGIAEVQRPAKTKYARLVVGKKTLAYANEKEKDVVLDFRASVLEDMPASIRAGELKGTRHLLKVSGNGDIKAAREMLTWVAKTVAS